VRSYYFGIIAEYIVSFFYILKFYSVLERRYKNYLGEIDLICVRCKTLVFIEVKGRSSNIDDILCTPNQQKRISNAATIFLQKNPIYQTYDLRFDLVVIRPYKLPYIIENAW
jgi:putative endonuclease